MNKNLRTKRYKRLKNGKRISQKRKKPRNIKMIGGGKTKEDIIAELKDKGKYDEWVRLGSKFGVTSNTLPPLLNRRYTYYDVDENPVNVSMVLGVYFSNPDVDNIAVFEPVPYRIGYRTDIEEDDIMYKDDLVCILKPNVKKGIVICTRFTQPEGMESLCVSGLKTGEQLYSEGMKHIPIKDGKGITIDGISRINPRHPYIFFKAPIYSNKINYSSVEDEIISSYGRIPQDSRIFIRVDPRETYVFSSQIRLTYSKISRNLDEVLNLSKKLLSSYLKIIYYNSQLPGEGLYDLITSEKVMVGDPRTSPYIPLSFSSPTMERLPPTIEPLLDENPVNENSEILVKIHHLPPEYFVQCND